MVHPLPRSWQRRALAPALAPILAAAALASVPVVDVVRQGAPHAQGVSETFLGREGGRISVYKPNAPIGKLLSQLASYLPWRKN